MKDKNDNHFIQSKFLKLGPFLFLGSFDTFLYKLLLIQYFELIVFNLSYADCACTDYNIHTVNETTLTNNHESHTSRFQNDTKAPQHYFELGVSYVLVQGNVLRVPNVSNVQITRRSSILLDLFFSFWNLAFSIFTLLEPVPGNCWAALSLSEIMYSRSSKIRNSANGFGAFSFAQTQIQRRLEFLS